MTIADAFTPERLADRAQIQEVIFRWCRAIDRLDYDAIRTVFHADAVDMHGAYNGPIDGLIEWIRGRHKTIPFSMHSVSNMLIEFGGPDLAVVESYLNYAQHYPANAKSALTALLGGKEGNPDAAVDMVGCGRYIDRFERRNGEWRIAHRTAVFDSTMLFDQSPNVPKMGSDWTVGRRDKDDFVYRARAAAGVQHQV